MKNECKRRQSPTEITKFGRFMTNSAQSICMVTNSATQDMQLAFINHNSAPLDSKDRQLAHSVIHPSQFNEFQGWELWLWRKD